MTIFEFIQPIKDKGFIRYRIFDSQTNDIIGLRDSDGEMQYSFDAELLLASKYACVDIEKINFNIEGETVYAELEIDTGCLGR